MMGLGVDFDRKFQETIAEVSIADAIAFAYKYLREPYVSLVGQQTTVENVLKDFSTIIR
ncbi:hypothetical protein RintRC_2131 [Richelia intracellularis]|nr:hypothetical protein RintRC_2131 [Richelia intracellularis]